MRQASSIRSPSSHTDRAPFVTHDAARGTVETLVADRGGLRLNSPTDVVVKSDGTIWFTDPSYGHLQGFRPEPQIGDHVYCFDPRTEDLSVVADSFDKPNGLAFSPDGSVLYVGDSGANQEPGSFDPDRPTTSRPSTSWTAASSPRSVSLRDDPGFPQRDQGRLRGPRLGPSVRGLRLQIHPLVGVVVDPVVPSTGPEEPTTLTPTDIIYQRRVRVLDHARETGNVAETCRTFGISRKT